MVLRNSYENYAKELVEVVKLAFGTTSILRSILKTIDVSYVSVNTKQLKRKEVSLASHVLIEMIQWSDFSVIFYREPIRGQGVFILFPNLFSQEKPQLRMMKK